VKSRCAGEWGGWGRSSDDGPGQNNPDPSEGPWGRWSIPPHGGAVIASTDPTLCGSTLKHEGRIQTGRRSAYAGSRLKLIDPSGRSRLTRQPFSRNGENSPYGMLGWIVKTSASFEARSAPRSYPTRWWLRRNRTRRPGNQRRGRRRSRLTFAASTVFASAPASMRGHCGACSMCWSDLA
jgi:hypothetical protein